MAISVGSGKSPNLNQFHLFQQAMVACVERNENFEHTPRSNQRKKMRSPIGTNFVL
jgi:hypothetical protein